MATPGHARSVHLYDLRYGKEMEDVIWPLMDTLMLGNQRDAAALANQLCEAVDEKFGELAILSRRRLQ